MKTSHAAEPAARSDIASVATHIWMFFCNEKLQDITGTCLGHPPPGRYSFLCSAQMFCFKTARKCDLAGALARRAGTTPSRSRARPCPRPPPSPGRALAGTGSSPRRRSSGARGPSGRVSPPDQLLPGGARWHSLTIRA